MISRMSLIDEVDRLRGLLAATEQAADCGGVNCGKCQQCLTVNLHFALEAVKNLEAKLAATEQERDEVWAANGRFERLEAAEARVRELEGQATWSYPHPTWIKLKAERDELEARVRVLEQERDEWKNTALCESDGLMMWHDQAEKAEARVRVLKQAGNKLAEFDYFDDPDFDRAVAEWRALGKEDT